MLMSRVTPTFEIDPDNNEALLCCGHCGCNYTHHTVVTVHSRPFEDGQASETIVQENGDLHTLRKATSRNPSNRRHGVTISFTCEGCNELGALTIAQHKGQTLLQWVKK